MKQIFTISFSLSAFIAYGQDTTFLDSDWNKVKSKQYATYFKIVSPNQADTNRVTETVYFRSGQVKTQKDYAVYKSRKLDGKLKEWFESGQIHKDIDYKDGKKDGQLFTYWDNGKLKRADKYENDRLIEGKCMTADGRDISHYDYEKLPQFPGGINALRNYLSKELKYPKDSRRAGIEGRVLVGFIVNKDGAITDIKVVQSVSDELDQEALRVVKKMVKWEPGTEDDEAVKVAFRLPVQFQLQ
jgi:periplasmic protein TonB